VKREVTQILSPGTHFDERMLVAERNNFLSAVCGTAGRYGLAMVDLTTGSFRTTELEGTPALLAELERLRPAEIIYPEGANALADLLKDAFRIVIPYEDWVFAAETAIYTVRDHFKVGTLDGFGLKDRGAAIGAVGAVLHYLVQHLRRDCKHLTALSFYQPADFLILDATTLRHLEILEPLHRDAPRNASLYGALNRTVTPMGARRLRDWLTQPLSSTTAIAWRQQGVRTFLACGQALAQFRTQLGQVRDLERTIGRLSVGGGNARDLLALRQALEQLPNIRKTLASCVAPAAEPTAPALTPTSAPARGPEQAQSPAAATAEEDPPALQELCGAITELPALIEQIARAIVDEPPLAVKEGGLIRDGFSPELDELRQAQRGGKDWLAKLQQDEIVRTGISSLKVRFNSVFGYFIEVTKANLEKVPGDYIRKQTVANGERFITPELKAMEGKILGAEERSVKLEYELFLAIREAALQWLQPIQRTADALAQLDVLGAFAENARLFNYCQPQVQAEGVLLIREGRHPVLDQTLVESRFVPNDTQLDGETQIALITGPNMAGKSTYIRQVALLALLAHTGSFVPATEARIDLVDRLFTRIG
ncbi:MAG TPA: DNA mismatch repair protein MutS, partial [Candidatus Dormibacteraeota bacterium]|nr:DNA mismatch repair protein MutS [Candidatus Dormibacteraeota bacterium]